MSSSKIQAAKVSLLEELKWLFEHGGYTARQQSDLLLFLERTFFMPWREVLFRTADKNADEVQRMLLSAVSSLMKQYQEVAEVAKSLSQKAEKEAREAKQKEKQAIRREKLAKKAVLQNDTTKLWNKAGFTRELSSRLRDRRVHAWALFYIDLRHFKDWNDTYDHEAGDLALKVFAEILSHSIRFEDRAEVFNPHGDEFAALLPLATSQYKEVLRISESVAERLCASIDACDWSARMQKIAEKNGTLNPLAGRTSRVEPIRADIGVACWLRFPNTPPLGRSRMRRLKRLVELYIQRADKDMKAAKDLSHGGFQQSAYVVSLYHWDGSHFRFYGNDVRTNLPYAPPYSE